jgi:hypothetical protein
MKGMFRWDVLGSQERLETAVVGVMSAIGTERALVKSFFKHPDVQYVPDALGW